MHTWLPDAHSQAISPISALLSGVLLKISLYAILRFGIIVVKCCGWSFYPNLMLIFGLFSLAVAAIFIIVQKDIKRLLAYSSIEHLGLISIGIGLGSDLAIFAALLHLFGHAITKSLMFFGAGKVAQTYNSHELKDISGVSRVLPATGIALLIGALALIGFPPGSIFISELLLVISAISSRNYFTAGALLFFLAIIGGAILFHFGKVIFGKPPEKELSPNESPGLVLTYVFLIVMIIGLGIFVPTIFRHSILSAVAVIKGI
jgi:hydrogenase-4 component F